MRDSSLRSASCVARLNNRYNIKNVLSLVNFFIICMFFMFFRNIFSTKQSCIARLNKCKDSPQQMIVYKRTVKYQIRLEARQTRLYANSVWIQSNSKGNAILPKFTSFTLSDIIFNVSIESICIFIMYVNISFRYRQLNTSANQMGLLQPEKLLKTGFRQKNTLVSKTNEYQD